MLAHGEPVHLLDVRQEWEHQTAALPHSQHIPIDQLLHRKAEIQVGGDALLVAYCHHGIRSLSAASWLQQQGFANVASLYGGIDAWSFLVDPTVPRY
jgi:rhodanese-related sulfurtransferase